MTNPSRMPSVRIFSKKHFAFAGARAYKGRVGHWLAGNFWLVVTFRLGASVPHDQFSGVVIVLE
ncbi:MAG: hypothetical protein BWX84_01641 [Verrucomicrobia bacterium ADurb.Bin118]|jgi:hypothetical protein|nr:MAG: hypothetical protein BWX84_01641 [Verrucomicrobia bacterium ADurb.Bin118]